jgi:hypothetical protein
MTMLASMPYPTTREAIDACQEGEVTTRLERDGPNLVVDLESAYELDAEGIEAAFSPGRDEKLSWAAEDAGAQYFAGVTDTCKEHFSTLCGLFC